MRHVREDTQQIAVRLASHLTGVLTPQSGCLSFSANSTSTMSASLGANLYTHWWM